jgi:hypothetical protein
MSGLGLELIHYRRQISDWAPFTTRRGQVDNGLRFSGPSKAGFGLTFPSTHLHTNKVQMCLTAHKHLLFPAMALTRGLSFTLGPFDTSLHISFATRNAMPDRTQARATLHVGRSRTTLIL